MYYLVQLVTMHSDMLDSRITITGRSLVKGAGPQVGKTREMAEEDVERSHYIGMTTDFGPVRLTKV